MTQMETPIQRNLIEQNLGLLERAREIVLALDDEGFAGFVLAGASTVGAQLRHCLDFFARLIADLPGGRIDYDRRSRDRRIERDRRYALGCIATLGHALAELGHRERDRVVSVRQDEAHGTCGEGWTTSSVSRELRFLASHTTHHFAIVGLILRAQGIPVDEELGVAPSTLSHEASRRRAAGVRGSVA